MVAQRKALRFQLLHIFRLLINFHFFVCSISCVVVLFGWVCAMFFSLLVFLFFAFMWCFHFRSVCSQSAVCAPYFGDFSFDLSIFLSHHNDVNVPWILYFSIHSFLKMLTGTTNFWIIAIDSSAFAVRTFFRSLLQKFLIALSEGTNKTQSKSNLNRSIREFFPFLLPFRLSRKDKIAL